MPEQGAMDQGPSSIKSVLILPVILITCAAGAALALVDSVTAGPIAASKKAEKAEALAAVMPAFANDPTTRRLDREASGLPLVFYAGLDDGGNVTGWGVESATETGYSGYLSVVFGIDNAGKVQSVKVLEQRETPGLGTKAAEPDFLDQYQGQAMNSFDFRVEKDGGKVEAISGATISSRAVSVCVEQGLQEYARSLEGQGPPPETREGGSTDGQ